MVFIESKVIFILNKTRRGTKLAFVRTAVMIQNIFVVFLPPSDRTFCAVMAAYVNVFYLLASFCSIKSAAVKLRKPGANVISVLQSFCVEVTGHSPVAGDRSQPVHPGQRQAVCVPSRALLVQWTVVAQGFGVKLLYCAILESLRHD